jgi:hypothetical protein
LPRYQRRDVDNIAMPFGLEVELPGYNHDTISISEKQAITDYNTFR